MDQNHTNCNVAEEHGVFQNHPIPISMLANIARGAGYFPFTFAGDKLGIGLQLSGYASKQDT